MIDENNVLKSEPEEWLNYHIGQQASNDPYFERLKKKYSGVHKRLMILAYWALKKTRIRSGSKKLIGSSNFLFFANTINQIETLKPSMKALIENDEIPIFLTEFEYAKRYAELNPKIVCFTVKTHLKGILLAAVRLRNLLTRLDKIHRSLKNNYLNQFMECYWYLPFFMEILRNNKNIIVITANDHNVSNRSLVAAAKYLGIKTVYFQHASVSGLFPALNFDYAFLDGDNSYETYLECEGNKPTNFLPPNKTQVLLTGQQKNITTNRVAHPSIGFALNALDDIDEFLRIAIKLVEIGENVIIRYHPSQPAEDIEKLELIINKYPNIVIDDPLKIKIGDFFSEILYLVAGNSGIHLEAALSGAETIYYESKQHDNPDYYGFCRNSISILAKTSDDIIKIVTKKKIIDRSIRAEAIRKYSATFSTKWQGQEGRLAGLLLQKIKKIHLKGESMDEALQDYKDIKKQTLIR